MGGILHSFGCNAIPGIPWPSLSMAVAEVEAWASSCPVDLECMHACMHACVCMFVCMYGQSAHDLLGVEVASRSRFQRPQD